MSDSHGHEYNYEASPYLSEPFRESRDIMRAGSMAQDFTLPTLDGGIHNAVRSAG
jgi:hypothetical protein